MDVGDWDACRAALPGGQSGHPLSGHYLDLLDGWVAGEYFPLLFSRPAIERETMGWLILSPDDRAARGDRAKFEAAMAKVADVPPPDERDAP
jgi:penicillin amidase